MSIGNHAFQACNSLRNITIPSSVMIIDDYAFLNCSSLTSITIPEGVIKIEGGSFSGCSSLTSISIPDSVTIIGSSAFSDCSSLSNITIPSSVMIIDDYAFLNCRSLTSITIPEGVSGIEYGAFYNCCSLTSIEIPSSVTSIDDYAFFNCYSITSITIPEDVTSIGYNSFYKCSSLTSIAIPSSVKRIDDYAFESCYGITCVVFAGDLPGILDNCFSGVHADVYYPDDGSWRDSDRQNYGGNLSWKAYHVGTPIITSQPESVTVAAGAKATFHVSAIGDDLSYQWQVYNTSTGKWANSGISSAKTTTLSFTAGASHDGMKYRCAVTKNGGTAYSSEAMLTIIPAPTITDQPKSITVTSGEKASFTVMASDSDLSYQWQAYNASRGKWANSGISSAKTATLRFTVSAGHNGMKYRCAVTNSGGTVYSNAATLTVSTDAKPVITKHPASTTVDAGTKVTFTVTATGTGLSYQWQVCANSDANWSNSSIASAKTTAMTFTPSDSINGYQYRCAVTNSAGTVYSNVAYLTVNSVATAKPTITRQPVSVNVSVGTKVTLTVAATGGGLSYQWQVRANSDANWSNSSISSAKTTTMVFTPSDSLNGYQYRCKVTNSFGTTVSNTAVLTISSTATAKPTITRQPASTSISEGSKVTLTVTATGGGLSYQWQVRKNSGSSWSNSSISSAKTTTMVFTPSASLNGYQYRCAVTNSLGTTYSNAATLTIK